MATSRLCPKCAQFHDVTAACNKNQQQQHLAHQFTRTDVEQADAAETQSMQLYEKYRNGNR